MKKESKKQQPGRARRRPNNMLRCWQMWAWRSSLFRHNAYCSRVEIASSKNYTLKGNPNYLWIFQFHHAETLTSVLSDSLIWNTNQNQEYWLYLMHAYSRSATQIVRKPETTSIFSRWPSIVGDPQWQSLFLLMLFFFKNINPLLCKSPIIKFVKKVIGDVL